MWAQKNACIACAWLSLTPSMLGLARSALLKIVIRRFAPISSFKAGLQLDSGTCISVAISLTQFSHQDEKSTKLAIACRRTHPRIANLSVLNITICETFDWSVRYFAISSKNSIKIGFERREACCCGHTSSTRWTFFNMATI